MSTDDRQGIAPHERLAEATRQINLAEAATQLRAEPHPARSGHRQIVLARTGPLSLLLFVFERDGLLKAHRADGEVVIQVLSGALEITLDSGAHTVPRGELLTIAPGETHAVRAIDASEMLLTVCRRTTA